jgi:hypothetical protein
VHDARFLTIATKLANIVFVIAAIGAILALSFVVYYYVWTGYRQFSSSTGALWYLGVPALLATGFIWSLRLRPSHRVNLAICVFTVMASTYTLELLLSVWFNLPSTIENLSQEARVGAARQMGVDFDTRSKGQVVDDLLKQGVDAVPSIFPMPLLKKQRDGTMKSVIGLNGAEALPLASISNKVNVLCNESGPFVTYRSDIHGLNNPQEVWNYRVFDIAAVGDSYTQGWCVPPEKNFVALIRERYGATLNLGSEADGPLLMLATIKEYAAPVKPKIVLWFYCEGNDLHDLSVERKSPLLMSYFHDGFSQGLFTKQGEIDRALTDYVKIAGTEENQTWTKLSEISALLRDPSQLPNGLAGIAKLSELRERLHLIHATEGNVSSSDTSTGSNERALRMAPLIDLFYQVLVEAKSSVNGWGGKLYFVYLPGWDRYVPGQTGNPDREQVIRAAQKAGLPVIDIHQDFEAETDPLSLFPFRMLSHYNEQGDRIVADSVLRSLASNE